MRDKNIPKRLKSKSTTKYGRRKADSNRKRTVESNKDTKESHISEKADWIPKNSGSASGVFDEVVKKGYSGQRASIQEKIANEKETSIGGEINEL